MRISWLATSWPRTTFSSFPPLPSLLSSLPPLPCDLPLLATSHHLKTRIKTDLRAVIQRSRIQALELVLLLVLVLVQVLGQASVQA